MDEHNFPKFKFAIRNDLDNTFLPTRGEPFATGWDVRAAFTDKKILRVRPGEYFKIPLGFRVCAPEGWWLELHPRSSSFIKKYMHNLIGIIDEHFFFEVSFVGQYIPDIHSMGQDLIINFGDRIGQVIPIQRVEMSVESLSNKEFDDICREKMAVRNGGFGSTGGS